MSRNQIIALVFVAVVIIIIIAIAYSYSKNKAAQDKEVITTTTTSSTTGLSALLGQQGSAAGIGAIVAGLSDERFKKNTSKYLGGSESIMNLIPYNFQYKRADGTEPCCDDCAKSGSHCSDDKVGFMAQQLELYNPSLVVTDEKGVKYVDYGMITALNTAALRDLALRVDGMQRVLNHEQN